jgi:hypothetical protein
MTIALCCAGGLFLVGWAWFWFCGAVLGEVEQERTRLNDGPCRELTRFQR